MNNVTFCNLHKTHCFNKKCFINVLAKTCNKKYGISTNVLTNNMERNMAHGFNCQLQLELAPLARQCSY